MKPKPPVKERQVQTETKKQIAKIVLVTAGTVAGASAIFIAGSVAAFRVPKDLRHLVPKKNSK
jgi:hypothetical protein